LTGSRASVLDCGSPLPLFPRKSWRRQNGRGLPQSKTWRNFHALWQITVMFTLEKIQPFFHF
jgi:hypothetical protein